MSERGYFAHTALLEQRARASIRYSPAPPKAPLWLPGQGIFVAILGSWNALWIGFFVVQLITRTFR